jgi:hypothetical protein
VTTLNLDITDMQRYQKGRFSEGLKLAMGRGDDMRVSSFRRVAGYAGRRLSSGAATGQTLD